MKARLIPIILAVFALSAGPLSASEWEIETLINTDLGPSAFGRPVSLPEAIAVEPLVVEAVPAPAQRQSMPIGLPVYKPSAKAGKALFEANLVLMVGLNIADYISTRAALKYPGLGETNPLMKPFVKSPAAFAAIKAGTTVLSYWSMKSIFKRNKTVAWIMTTASNALLSYVVANNVRLIQGARAR